MAKVKLYRFTDTGTMCLQISNGNGKVSRHSLPISLTADQWNGKQVTAAHPQRMEVSAYLNGVLAEAQLILSQIMREQPTRNMPATQLRDLIAAALFKDEQKKKELTFLEAYDLFTRSHANGRTRAIYEATRKRISEYDARALTFEQVNRKWLDGFSRWLEKRSPSVNARAIHLRNIRAAFNYAIDEELTALYPFRRYKIKREETAHRDLTLEDLQKLFAYQPPTERPNPHATKPLDYAVKYIQLARLMFCLIGINIVDLSALKPADYYGGRIHYRRAKTGRLYDIKVEPEAAAIIREMRGSTKLLAICERGNYRSLAKQLNKVLRGVSASLGLPPVTTYWLRHTWATLAYMEGASTDLVSDCLGHKHGSPITAVYINRGRGILSKDELNRAVLDKVFAK